MEAFERSVEIDSVDLSMRLDAWFFRHFPPLRHPAPSRCSGPISGFPSKFTLFWWPVAQGNRSRFCAIADKKL